MKILKIKHTYTNFELNIENLTLKKNTIIGLVGKNGAGKSTLMSILAGYLIANNSCQIQDLNLEKTIYIPSELELYDYLSVSEFLFLLKKYSSGKKNIESILDILELTTKRDTLISKLSEGMRKKLTLAPLFIKNYELIILDEPFNSIDLNYIYTLKKYLLTQKKNSLILISSHILDTLVDICDEIVLIENGLLKKQIVNDKNIKNLEREIFVKDI